MLIINANKRKPSLSENTHFHARRCSYNLAFKLKIVAEAEAVEGNSEIAREYGISESICPTTGGKIKRTSLMESSRCQRNAQRWAITLRNICSWMRDYLTGLQSREAKVSFLFTVRDRKFQHISCDRCDEFAYQAWEWAKYFETSG